MRITWTLFLAAACAGSPTQAVPHPLGSTASASADTRAPATPGPRCLPVVARLCGCVYSCGSGTPADDHWIVTHGFWPGTTQRAQVEPWCVDGACTDVFAAEILCLGLCGPRPGDPTCHLDAAGACVGASST